MFDRPWALALLAAVPILLLLRRRAALPRAAEASSLLVWRRIVPEGAPPPVPRPPVAAWLEAAGVALLALAVADPVIAAGPAPSIRVLLDGSPSMNARTADGTPRTARARAALSATGWPVDLQVTPVPEVEARVADAAVPLLVLTDHRPERLPEVAEGMRVVGFGDRVRNAGIAAVHGTRAGTGDIVATVTVVIHGLDAPETLRVRWGSLEVVRTVGGDGTLTLPLARSVAAASEAGEIVLELPGDALPDDDRVGVRWREAAPVRLTTTPADPGRPGFPPAFVRAFLAAGARGDVAPPGGPTASLVLDGRGSDGVARTMTLVLADGSPGMPVAGAAVAATDHGLVRDVRIDPAVAVGTALGRTPEGVPLLVGPDGALLTVAGEGAATTVRFGFLPGADWLARDPAVVVLAQNLVEEAAGGPARMTAEGVLDAGESAAEGETFGDVEAALQSLAAATPGARRPLAVPLLVVAALLLFGAVRLGGHRTRPSAV